MCMHRILNLSVATGIEVMLIRLHGFLAAPPLHILDQLSQPSLHLSLCLRLLINGANDHGHIPVASLMDIHFNASIVAGRIPRMLTIGLGRIGSSLTTEEEGNGGEITSALLRLAQIPIEGTVSGVEYAALVV